MLRTAHEWLVELGYHQHYIMDPDGWRHNDGVTMDTPITEEDFRERLLECTVMFMPNA